MCSVYEYFVLLVSQPSPSEILTVPSQGGFGRIPLLTSCLSHGKRHLGSLIETWGLQLYAGTWGRGSLFVQPTQHNLFPPSQANHTSSQSQANYTKTNQNHTNSSRTRKTKTKPTVSFCIFVSFPYRGSFWYRQRSHFLLSSRCILTFCKHISFCNDPWTISMMIVW